MSMKFMITVLEALENSLTRDHYGGSTDSVLGPEAPSTSVPTGTGAEGLGRRRTAVLVASSAVPYLGDDATGD